MIRARHIDLRDFSFRLCRDDDVMQNHLAWLLGALSVMDRQAKVPVASPAFDATDRGIWKELRRWMRDKAEPGDIRARGGALVALDRGGNLAGAMNIWPDRAAHDRCDPAFERLSAMAGFRLRRHVVIWSRVRDGYMGAGLGVEMYVRAARAVAPEAALCADWCDGGTTSMEARRVWSSRRLAELVAVDGLVAWGGVVPESM